MNNLLRFIIKNFSRVILVLTIAIIIYINYNSKKHIEPFNNSISYNECINKGYSKEFCVQTPTSVLGPSSCLTPDGEIGYTVPGFRGKCVVQNDLINY